MKGTPIRLHQLRGCDRCIWHLSTLAEGQSTSDVSHNIFDEAQSVEKGDVVVLSGYATEEDAGLLKDLRSKASRIVLYGTCPHTGGVFGLSNQRGGKVVPVSRIINVDFTVTGCPPDLRILQAYLEKGQSVAHVPLCKSCGRTFTTGYLSATVREPNKEDTTTCYNNQGVPCSGVVAGECNQRCIDFNTPCRGCVPSTAETGPGMLGYFTSLAGQIDVDTRATGWTTDMLGEKPDELTAGLPDVVGTFFRFTLASEFLPGGKLPSSGEVYSDIMLGRRVEEAPQIAATIYGSRAVSVTLNLVEAAESSLGINVTEQVKALRTELRDLQTGWIEQWKMKDTKGFAKITDGLCTAGGNELLSNVGYGGFKVASKAAKGPLDTYVAPDFEIKGFTGSAEDEYSKVSVACDENGIIREWSCELR
jgi:F420-non-reducing hydrogenase small subunit